MARSRFPSTLRFAGEAPLVDAAKGIFFPLFALLLSPNFASHAAELEQVRGEVLVSTESGHFATYAPGMPVKQGARILVTHGASAVLQDGGCQQPLRASSIYRVEQDHCPPADARFVLASLVATSDTAALTGFVWNDLDEDSVRDPGEAARAGVRVALVGGPCKLKVDCPVTTSDTDGNFGFASLMPGTYDVGTIDDDGRFKAIGVVVLEPGSTTTIAIAASTSGFVLLGSTQAAAVLATTGSAATTAGAVATGAIGGGAVAAGVAAAAVVGTAADLDTGSDGGGGRRPPISP